MVYPSHYGAGELGIDNPNANPQRTVALSLAPSAASSAARDTRMCRGSRTSRSAAPTSLADVKAQILAARRVKSQGFLLWNAEGVYTAERARRRLTLFIHRITHRRGGIGVEIGGNFFSAQFANFSSLEGLDGPGQVP